MREYLFRGQIIGTKDWVIGSLIYSPSENQYYIVEHCDEELSFPVYPETVGQYTGLCDKNGKKVFEGDIVRYSPNLSNTGKILDTVGTISWHQCGLFVINGHSYWDIGHIFNSECKEWAGIIGNIHDNPELLEVEE